MALVINIKVTPSSGCQRFSLDKNDTIRCFLKKPAENNQANSELIKLISKKLKLSCNDVKIMLGAKSRNKRIKIEARITFSELLIELGIEKQMSI